jgi:hypothetical protein
MMTTVDLKARFLLDNGLVQVDGAAADKPAGYVMFGTVISNMVHYGYLPNKELYARLGQLDEAGLVAFWTSFKPVLEQATAADKNVDRHIVYKNFPQEVLDMDRATYWMNQICIYFGITSEDIADEEQSRDPLLEKQDLKVLQLADENSLKTAYDRLVGLPNKWTPEQTTYACDLMTGGGMRPDLGRVPFKDNMVLLAVKAIEEGIQLSTRSATDVMRLATVLCGATTPDEKVKFKLGRPKRRFLLSLLDNATDLEGDMARDKGRWKKLMVALRPGDYGNAYKNVKQAYHNLYGGQVRTFNSRIEVAIANKDENVLTLLQNRPGEFARRLQKLIGVFGGKAIDSFESVAGQLKVIQLLKLARHFDTIDNRKYRTVAPKGNWTKLRIQENEIQPRPRLFRRVVKVAEEAIRTKVSGKVAAVNLDPRVADVALQGNDSDLADYGRNTKFDIPENANFIRTASYWEAPGRGNIWFDNGFNFFDRNWKSVGTICWNTNAHGGLDYAVFSGDPVSGGNSGGKACQMIDLYLDKAKAAGVRYAVWNLLAYSHIKFSDVQTVRGLLQWGEKPMSGKTFEPSRCQLSLEAGGDSLTKYIAIIDVVDRKVIYIDANLKGNVRSAATNASTLEQVMPAYMEYLETQPTIADLFADIPQEDDGVPILYNDDGVSIPDDSTAFVFRPVNDDNKFSQLDITELLNL